MNPYRILAELVVIVHAAYAIFIVAGLAAIVVGLLLGRPWAKNFWFRTIHFLMIAVVVVEGFFGMACPLTSLEAWLRGRAGQTAEDGTFLARMAHSLLFWPVPEWVLIVLQILFGLVILLTFLLAPPRWPQRWTRRSTPPSVDTSAGGT